MIALSCLQTASLHRSQWGNRGKRRRPGAPITSPSLPGSPRGAAMAMVIMSPLSELTDTDGFEMHSASQWAPGLPAPPCTQVCQAPLCWVLGYPGVTARPSSTAQPASSSLKRLFACLGGRLEGDAFCCTATHPPSHWEPHFLLPPPSKPPDYSWPELLIILKVILDSIYVTEVFSKAAFLTTESETSTWAGLKESYEWLNYEQAIINKSLLQ